MRATGKIWTQCATFYHTQQKFFLNEKSPQDFNAIETMDPSPSAAFFELMSFWVVPTKNLELFKIFVPLMLSNINLPANSQQCADILITCLTDNAPEVSNDFTSFSVLTTPLENFVRLAPKLP